jgi:hypothetical protein
MLQKNGFFRAPDPAPARGLMPPAAPPVLHETVKEAPKSAEKPEQHKEARLVVGPDIKMKGVEVNDCDTLQVEGRIEATLDARVLEITEKGVFSGTVAVDNAEIHGRLEGELTGAQAAGRACHRPRVGQDPLRAHQGGGRRGAVGRNQRAGQKSRGRAGETHRPELTGNKLCRILSVHGIGKTARGHRDPRAWPLGGHSCRPSRPARHRRAGLGCCFSR